MGGTLWMLLWLTVGKTIGFSPLRTSVLVRTDADFAAGTVCLIWESPDEAATPGTDCWTVTEVDRHGWTKQLTLRTGHYEVWVTTVGQDTKGHAVTRASTHQVVEAY